MADTECVFCDGTIAKGEHVDCMTCGKYQYYPWMGEAYTTIEDRHLVSGYIREDNLLHDRYSIFETPESCEEAKRRAPRTLPSKALKLLRMVEHLRDEQQSENAVWVPLTVHDYPLAYCEGVDEFNDVLTHCENQGWLRFYGKTELTPERDVSVELTEDGAAKLRK